jgi:glucokinase
VLVTDEGEIVQRELRPTGADFAEVVRALVAELGHDCPVGISAPGLAAPDGRSIAHMPARMPGLAGLDWTTHLQRRRPVPVLNDAHAALLGEAWTGAAAGVREVVLLTLGTGVGGASLTAGRLQRGATGRAGHWGHISLDPEGPPSITGMPGSLEGAIGNCTVAARTQGRFTDTRALVEAHRAGDPLATRVWRRSVRDLAVAIASIANAVDPETVVVGGGIARAGAALFDPLAEEMARVEWRAAGRRVRITPAALGDLAGAIGAARAALTTEEP